MSADDTFDETTLLPRALENLAKDYPEATWMTVPNDSRLTQGWRNITYADFGQAVDGFAHWAQDKLDAAEVVAYMGINDVRYAVAEIGLMKTGRTAFLPSPRNSTKSSVSLFEDTASSTLLHSESMDSQVKTLKSAIPALQTYLIPSFDQLRSLGAQTAYKSQQNVLEDAPAVILQTSGSTSLPRPIRITNGGISTFKYVADLALPPGLKNQPGTAQAFGKAILSMAPFFHEAGSILIVRSILCKGPAILLPSDRPPTAELVLEVMRQTKPSILSIFPSLLEDLVDLPEGLAALALVDLVTYGGAPLAQETGDKVCGVTFLYSGIGSTEAGVLATELPRDRKDWNYFAWAPASGVEMRPRDDGLCEGVIKRIDRKYQRIFHIYPDIIEYCTKDLFERHPTNPGLWRFRSRADDVLVLSNGEKLNPVDFEKRVELHPLVKGAIVVGQNQFQTVLLIEPRWDIHSPAKSPVNIVEELWPTIEEANQILPKYGAVWKSMITIATNDKPFVRTSSKGNIVRSKSTELYATEIAGLYANELGKGIEHLPPGASLSKVESILRSCVEASGLPMPSGIPNHQDLFALGMDSLQTLQLTSIINQNLGGAMSTAEVYKHPTISSLAEYMAKRDQSSTSFAASDREKVMSDMTEKYTHDMKPRDICQLEKDPSGQCVLLTGSTGNLGCLLLHELIKSSNITRVFCLNRAVDGRARQSQQFVERGLPVDFSKITFLHSKDFGQHHLGLSLGIYEELLQAVSLVMMNAWTVDFNKNLQSFEGLIAGTREFVDLSIASQQQAHILMVSSVASIGNWASICSDDNHSDLEVPERVISNNKVPAPGGYGESKHVASLVLAAAAEAGVTSTIVRVGQLAGPAEKDSKVEWSRREWIPSMIATSRMLGAIPDQLGGVKSIDWIPVDLAAKAIIEIAQASSETRENPRILHVVNPKTTTWEELLPAVQASLAQELGKNIPIITYADWIAKLREIPKTQSNAERVPGIKLLDFFEGLGATRGTLRLATTNTVKMSSTIAELRPVDAYLMERWVNRM